MYKTHINKSLLLPDVSTYIIYSVKTVSCQCITYYATAPIAGALSDDAHLKFVCLTSVGLSVVHIGPQTRTERPRKTKLGTEGAHVTCDTSFKVKRSNVNLQGAGHIVAASRTACFIDHYSKNSNSGSDLLTLSLPYQNNDDVCMMRYRCTSKTM